MYVCVLRGIYKAGSKHIGKKSSAPSDPHKSMAMTGHGHLEKAEPRESAAVSNLEACS